jgi:hypothetical protein
VPGALSRFNRDFTHRMQRITNCATGPL